MTVQKDEVGNPKNQGAVLVTGASAGIGRATALQLAAQQRELVLLARREDRLREVKDQALKAGSPRVSIFAVDVSNKDSIAQFSKTNSKLLERVSALINNAGLAAGTDKIQDARVSDWEVMMQTNVMGLLYLTHEVLPYLQRQPQADIVNLGSVAGRWTYPGAAVYCASKFAVRALTEGLRLDLMGHNIRVCNVEPGMVETEFSLVRLGSSEKAKAVYQNMTPLVAEDIAETICWVLSRPRHVNIQELIIYPTDQAGVGFVTRRP